MACSSSSKDSSLTVAVTRLGHGVDYTTTDHSHKSHHYYPGQGQFIGVFSREGDFTPGTTPSPRGLWGTKHFPRMCWCTSNLQSNKHWRSQPDVACWRWWQQQRACAENRGSLPTLPKSSRETEGTSVTAPTNYWNQLGHSKVQ